MRFKEDVRSEAGTDFPQRRVIPLAETSDDADAREEAVYARLARLRRNTEDGDSNAIVRWGLYKRFLSSPEACRSTVERTLRNIRRNEDEADIDPLEDVRKVLSALSVEGSTRYRLLKSELRRIGWDGSPDSPRVLLFTESTVTQEALAGALAKDFGLTWSNRQEKQPDQVMATVHGSMADVWLTKTVEAFGTGNALIQLS